MQSLTRGWSFLQEAWQMAFKDNDLIKPSFYSMMVGFIITVIGIVPLIAAAFLFGGANSLIGQVAMVVVSAVLIFIHYVVSYLFSGMTVYLIYGYLAEGDGRMDKAWAIVQREFWHILSLAAASTVVNLFTNSLRRRSSRSRNVVAGMAGNAAGGILETVWTEASFLILPAMMIEDANLVTGIKRATYIAKNNLLLIGVSTVGVKWITGFISFVLGVIGLVIGVGLGLGIVSIANSSTVGIIFGIGVGAILFFIFVMVASVISSYTMTAYNTCLFLWARDVEKAQAQGRPIQVAAPAPLAAALS
ncbi:MAG TPA: hypothetical protein VLX61_06255 [Anaerolineales bacterium]|nr:hypothetical protein [Anaerolineales bacterium]